MEQLEGLQSYVLFFDEPNGCFSIRLMRARIFRRITIRRRKKVHVSVKLGQIMLGSVFFLFITANCTTAKNSRASLMHYVVTGLPGELTCFGNVGNIVSCSLFRRPSIIWHVNIQ